MQHVGLCVSILVVMIGSATASGLTVSTYPGGADVVENGVVNATWGESSEVSQGCRDYWTDFYVHGPAFALGRNSTQVSSTEGIASAALFRYSADSSRLGVQLTCEEVNVPTYRAPPLMIATERVGPHQPHIHHSQRRGQF